MSTVSPVPNRIVPSTTAGTLNTTAIALNATQVLQGLQAGQTLQATISALIAANQVQVTTALGQLTLQTNLPLPPGAVLTLVLTSQTPQPTFQITTVNGKAVQGANLHGAHVQGGQATLQPSTQLPALTPGTSITVTLLRPALGTSPATTANAQPGHTGPVAQAATTAHAPAPSAPSQPTPSGTIAPTATANAQAPSPQATAHSGTRTNAGQASAPSTPTSQPTSSAAQPQAPATTLPAGTRFAATVERIETPSAAVSTPATSTGKAALATGQVLSGTIMGRTASGQPIVQTPNATFALGAQSALGEGAKVTFRLNSAPLAPAPGTPSSLALSPSGGGMHDLITAKSWGDFDDALKTLAGADPARLAQVAQNAVPQAGPKLSNQLLFFISALKGGDLKGLFGDSAMRVIDKERPGLLSRLGSDFQAMSKLVDEPQQGDWRLALIPMWSGEKLEQIRFFWRGNNPEDADESEEETRFVLDLDLSQLGHLQIDGLVKAKRKHLDLIIRTDQPLPGEMRADIADIFETARDILGLGGQVAFQASPGNFITVPSATTITPAPTVSNGLLA